jgi:hypothetical protein
MSCNNLELTEANCFSVDIGKYYILNFEYQNPDGSPVDFTGFTFAMNIKLPADPANFLTLGMVTDLDTTGIFMPNPASGIFQIIFTEATTATAAEPDTDYNYDIVITNPSGKEETFLYGLIKFVQRVP